MSWRINLAPVLPRRQSPSDDIAAKKPQDHKLQEFTLWELVVKEILPNLCATRELGILLGERSQSECDVVHYDL